MLRGFAALLVCQLAGEALTRALGLPVPGPVLGLMILFLGLAGGARLRLVTPESVERTEVGRTATALLAVLGILFVPAGVGVVQQAALLRANGAPLLIALFGSTLLALISAVLVFVAVGRLTVRQGRGR